MLTPPDVETWTWPEVRRLLQRHWSPGEHVGVFAPTGTGKTYLWSRCLAPLWSHTLTIDIKDGDPDNRAHARHLNAKLCSLYPSPDVNRFWGGDPYPEHHYWLEPREADIVREVTKAMSSIYASPAKSIRVVYIDEFKITAARDPDGHGLFPWTNRYLRRARGRKITLVGATQSPWWIGPGGADLFGQPRWFFVGRTTDEKSLDRYKEISGMGKTVIYETIPYLDKHEWLMRSADQDLTIRFTPPGPKQRVPAPRKGTRR